MKKNKLLFVLTLIFTFNIYGQESDYVKPIDRSVQPKQGKTPTIDLKKPSIFTLKNGLTVIVVENKKLPTFSLRISIDNPPTSEGDKSGLSQLSNALFGEGSKNIPKDEFNEELAKAGRVADFLELGELFAKDALSREESCGGHFRDEHQTPEGEAMRDKNYQFVSAWEYTGEPKDAVLHKEELKYNDIEVKERSYK